MPWTGEERVISGGGIIPFPVPSSPMDYRLWVLLLVLTAGMVIAGCSAPLSTGTPRPEIGTAPVPAVPGPLLMTITAEPPEYSPLMSSTPGIRLSVLNTSGILPPGAVFRWETSYGYFLSWAPPEFQVVSLGPVHQGGPEDIYWSYDPMPSEKERPEVAITLTVTDPVSGAPLADRHLFISWKDHLVAVPGQQS